MESRTVRIEELLAHAGWVRGLAARLVRDPSVADDVTQEVWARALSSPPRERTNLRGWLAATVRTTAQAFQRSQSRRSEHEGRARNEREEPSPAELVERAQLHRVLVEEVLALGEPQRSIVLAHWFEGRSITAIAERRGITPRVAKARLDEAHAELRRRLDASSGGRAAWLAAFSAWTQPPAAVVGTGSGIVIGGLAMGTMVKVSIACAAALLLWLGFRNRESLAPAEPATVGVAQTDSVTLTSVPSSPETQRAALPATRSSLDAVLVVHVRDATTQLPIGHARVRTGFMSKEHEQARARWSKEEFDEFHLEHLTPDSGDMTLRVPSGLPFVLSTKHDDCSSGGLYNELEAMKAGERRELTVKLNIALDVHFFARILAREDRRPIEGAAASLILHPTNEQREADRAHRLQSVTEDAARSDSTGLLEFWVGSWRLMHLRVHAPGFAPAFVFPEGHSTPDDPLEVLLDRGAAVQFHVVDLAGMPVESVLITLDGSSAPLVQPMGSSPKYGTPGPVANWTASTRADGRCTLDELPSGMTLRPKLSKPGVNARGTPDPFVLVPGDNPEILWRFGASCALSGRVLDADDKPVAGLEIWLRCQSDNPHSTGPKRTSYFFQQYSSSLSDSTFSDASGVYRFERVAPGIAWVGPACRRGQGSAPISGELAPIADEVEIPETAQSIEHDIHVQPGLYVRGRVVDPQGKPVRTSMRLRAAGGNHAWSDQSAQDGTFTAGPVGEGAFVLTADPPLWGSFAGSEELSVDAGDSEVVVKLRQGAALEASIVDDESGEACKGRIVLSLRGGDSVGRTLNLSQDPTHFSSTCVLPGIYDVMARTQDGRVGIVRGVDIQPTATTDLVVRVTRGAKLRARLEGKHAWGALIVHNGEAEVVRDAVSRGALFEAWVPPGHLVIEFTPVLTEKPQRREIDVKAGEEQELVFRDED